MRIYYCPICEEEHHAGKAGATYNITDQNFHGERVCKECKKHLKEMKKNEKQR